jgi:Cell wall-associated hydrolases (invasion-associated proteins)
MPILRPYFTPFLTPSPVRLAQQLNSQQAQQKPTGLNAYSAYIEPQPNQPQQFEQPAYNTADVLGQQFLSTQELEKNAFRPTPQANDPLAATGTNPITNFLQTSQTQPDFQTFYNQLQGIEGIGQAATATAQAQAAARSQSMLNSLGGFDVSGAANGQAAAVAKSLVGVPYVWGGVDKNGIDCSGLVYYVLNHSGVKVPRLIASQYGKMGQAVSLAQARPGDVVYYDNPGATDHVGIYIGNGKMIDAPYAGARVRVDNVGNFTSIRRIGTPATGTTPMGINAGLGGSRAQNAQLGKQLLMQAGLGSQWNPFNALVMSESEWDNHAQNPHSSAFGIGQFLNSTWSNYGSKTADPRAQILYMLKYIKDRYGTPAKAWAFKQQNNWY